MSFPAPSRMPNSTSRIRSSTHTATRPSPGQSHFLVSPMSSRVQLCPAHSLCLLRHPTHPAHLAHPAQSLRRPGSHLFPLTRFQRPSALRGQRGLMAESALPIHSDETQRNAGCQTPLHSTRKDKTPAGGTGNDKRLTGERIQSHRSCGGEVPVRRQRHTRGLPAQVSPSAASSDTHAEAASRTVSRAVPGADPGAGPGRGGAASPRQAGLTRRLAVLGGLCLASASVIFAAAPGPSLGADMAVDLRSKGSTLVGASSQLASDVASDLGLTLWWREAGASTHENQVLSGLAAVSDADSDTVRGVVRGVLSPPKCPGALRLAFHDAGTFDQQTGTGGMNGSIIYELDRPESNGLKRSVKILTKAKEQLAAQGLDVSWADIIAVAGAEAVEMCGGPHIPVRLGRVDSGKADEPGRMPAETLNGEEVIGSFASKGFGVQETVVLLGAHTLGGKGFGDATAFDNSYFSILLQRPWNDTSNKMAYMIGLPSDKAIVENDSAQKWIEIYASDQQRFFKDFAVAYAKLVDSGAVWQA